MLLYHWVMIALGGLSIIGSLIFFAFKVLRYLWRIEQAVEQLVRQNEVHDAEVKKMQGVLESHSAKLNIDPEIMFRKRSGTC